MLGKDQGRNKRAFFRLSIRARQVEDIISKKREQLFRGHCYQNNKQKQSNRDWRSQTKNKRSPHEIKFQTEMKQKDISKVQLIDRMLFSKPLHAIFDTTQNSDFLAHKNIIYQIWRLCLNAQDEKCLSRKATQFLTHKIEEGYEQLQNQSFAQQSYENLSLIIWVLLNQFYKLDQMLQPISKQIIRVCINFFHFYRLNFNQRCSNVEMCSHKQNSRQYTFGLLIMLLGNTLTSEDDVRLLLKKIPLFQLVELLEIFINHHPENHEDVTFLVSNILFYYPEDICVSLKDLAISVKISCQNQQLEKEKQLTKLSKLCKKEQLDIIKLLQNLCSKSFKSTLVYLRELGEGLRRKTEDLQYGEEKSFYNKILSQDNILFFSQQQLFIVKNLPLLHKNITPNYIQDLFQCVDKTHLIFNNLLYSENFLFRIPYIKPILEEKAKDSQVISIFREVQLKLERLCQLIIHVLLISEYESLRDSFPHLVYIPNKIFLFFLRDIFRKFNFQIDSVPDYCLLRQYPIMVESLKQRLLERKGRQILKYCHRKIMGNQQKLNENKVMSVCISQQERDQFNAALWQIYEQIILLSAPLQRPSNKQTQKLFFEQIQWLQLRLINAKIGLIGFTQLRKMVEILSKYYPLLIPYKQVRSQSSGLAQYQLDLNKLRQLFHLLSQKLVEFQDFQDYVLVFLSGIGSVKQRVEKKELMIKVDNKWQRIDSQTGRQFLIPQSIKKLLNESILTKYRLMQDSDSIDGQIYRIGLSILTNSEIGLVEYEENSQYY